MAHCIYDLEYHTAVVKNEVDLHILTCKLLQDKLTEINK